MDKFDTQFITNAGMKDILGRGLINDDSIAIIELVKNAKDAGSPSVNISFQTKVQEVTSGSDESLGSERKVTKEIISELIISDYGKGMSESDINTKWLNIAYSEKKGTNKGYAGNKGVGRFSCDRLGKYLLLYTKSKDGNFIKLPIDWSLFEGKSIDDEISTIRLKGERLDKSTFIEELGVEDFDTGTVLKIQNLRNNWSSKKLKKLLSELEKFSPSLDSDFEVYIKSNKVYDEADALPKANGGKVNNSILDKLNLKTTRILSVIDDEGKYISTKLFFQDEVIYSYKAENLYKNLKGVRADVHYLDTVSKAYFKRKTGVSSVDYGSVFLFYNGFRISPYGNPKNDWLALDQRKSQGSSRNLGTREIFGRIDISDKEELFSVITSREGLSHNEAYLDLVTSDEYEKTTLTSGKEAYGFVILILRQLENFVVGGLNWNRLIDSLGLKKVVTLDDVKRDPDRYKSSSLDSQNVKDVLEKLLKSNFKVVEHEFNQTAIENIKRTNQGKLDNYKKDFIKKTENKTLSDLSPSEKGIVKKILDSESAAKEAAIEERDFAERKVELAREDLFIEREKNQYLLESRKHLSPDAEGLIHTIKFTNSKIKTISSNLIEDVMEDNIEKDQLIIELSKILANSEKALKMTQLATKAEFDSNSDVQDINIPRFIEEYLNDQTDDYTCRMLVEYGAFHDTVIKRIDLLGLTVVLDNLMSNSDKWGASKINVSFESTLNNRLRVIFSDDGVGVSERFVNNPDSLFELGTRDTPINIGSGGSGIGLYHVRQSLEQMKANISFVGNNKVLKGASFQLEFK
ncbi:ATP-binding protein [Shewanella sp. c952]|uniref:ATP-binding protein n=1 Tax=Shewanella sp. c952 TaxID=2815913 RepID=UPI001C7E0E54|nr:ATP-binding protein [Shewanella sp. c952]